MVFIVMGVSGCGKTTVGQLLAKKINIPFYDADDFHPKDNVEKMQNGLPLNDDDRKPWLTLLAKNISDWNKSGGAVLACSALKKSYRDLLKTGSDSPELSKQVRFIYLKGSKELIYKRLLNRSHHYMPPDLLESQFRDLEEPHDALYVQIDQKPQKIVHDIIDHLEESKSNPHS